ncbi:HutD family protein [Thiomonas sp. FB-6]|uniref:HutD/Ves family protein n=1 Tax=Thiomonas sp. FB-6 TaxID=1158291 RepID=UPI0018CABAD4|nr:HutD family protein [Thiomonas sp. FB-6]
MNPLLLACDSVAPRPWRNGGGVTRELLARPAVATWRVRVSVADIASDGPFSAWPGITRWFAVVDGAGVELRIGSSSQHQLLGADALCFSGDVPVECRLLHGPTRDLNLMLRDTPGFMQPARVGTSWTPHARSCGFFATRWSRCRHTCARGEDRFTDVPRFTLLWFERAPRRLSVDADDHEGDGAGYWIGVGDP